ncbi:tripartite ATP-independent transporter DctM subunit [Spinactinospora alkalitolerans]|uniref:Tripartite ATP-independent transporter DctM subunit n=1 Tax=Spinactinospora alkalitolerans TaxID=687207 RepID=A0A852U4Q8_9ACTN|nr:TRAP transporter large permease [Spinactinospora alkalitolerans]NYE50515.1 tripartite ATP-independent transporter DctM subunit [Spinactinospora alkalitolerans]
MTPTLVAILGIVIMLGILFLRMPVSFAMLGVGFVGAVIISDVEAALHLMAADVYRQFSSYTMAVVPLFILMGQIVFRTGMSGKLFDAAYTWIGHLPGGVAATTITASIGFSAVSGSNSASTATIGAVALPEMRKYGYSRRLSGGAVAVGGTLGILIPPSTALIIIAVQSQQSITKLFQAALAPGILVGVLLLATVFVMCWFRPELGPPGPKATWRQRLASLSGVIEVGVLFLVAIGGLFAGLFTPTEAAAVGAFGAIVIGVIGRSLTWAVFWKSVIETLRVSAMVILLVAGAVVFGRFLTLSRLPFDLAERVASLPVAPIVIVLIVVAIYLVGGAIMDALGFLVISIPLLFPLITGLGYDIVWFTVIVVLVTTIGAVTPPVGVNAFITSGLDRSLDAVTVFRGTLPFLIPFAVAMTVFIVWPGTVLFAVD